jgi:hypothetical protein
MLRLTVSRYIPKSETTQEHQHPDGLGVVYTYEANGKPLAIAYAGKANKPSWHHSFIGGDPHAMRQAKVEEFFKNLSEHERHKTERRAVAKAPHTLAVGDIVYNSWGYDQTNVDFYEVVKTSANYVWLRQLQQETKETSFMSGPTTPILGKYRSEEVTQHRANSQNYVCFEHGSGSKWDGQPQRSSWYA